MRPQPFSAVQPRVVVQQRKPPVAPLPYRPQPKTVNLQRSQSAQRTRPVSPIVRPQPVTARSIQQKTASHHQHRLPPTPAGRRVIQRYTLVNEKNFSGKMSENGVYVTGQNLSEMYALPGHDVERSYKTAEQAVIGGATYDVWKPSLIVIEDCVAAMEEIMHGKKLKYGAPSLSEYRDISAKKSKSFGASDSLNRKRGRDSDLGDKADPGLLEGYVIARQSYKRDEERPQFHGAAVVAQDGEDNVTLETSAPLSGKISPVRVAPIYDMYSTGKKRKQSFKSAYRAEYGKDASVSVVKPIISLPKDVLAPLKSVKVIDF